MDKIIKYQFFIKICLIFCGCLLLLSLIIYFIFFRSSLPLVDGVRKVSGIHYKVDIMRSEKGVPFIKANQDSDAFFALGYVHAQDRLWQMEMRRRVATGTLSEILGRPALHSDYYMRTLGFSKDARKSWDQLGKKERESLSAYTAGINQWIDENNVLPIEFKLLGYKPKHWATEDSLSCMYLMAWYMSANFPIELERANYIQTFGLQKALQLYPDIAEEAIEATRIKNNDETEISILELQNLVGHLTGLMGPYVGSNNWVVSGKHTQSGFPILANDPHLEAQIPSPWYMARLEGDKLNVQGATFPGLPFVIIGRNEKISWGITVMNADAQDIFYERIEPLNKNAYLVDGTSLNMNTREEIIKVRNNFLKRGPGEIKLKIRETNHGPLLSDVVPNAGGHPFSVKWSGQGGLGGTYSAFFRINYTEDWHGFNEALRDYVAPALNFVYADVAGNIGYLTAGKIPVRLKGTGAFPVPGWNSAYDWRRWIPFEELPRQFNPSPGLIVTANNNVTPYNYPYHLSSDWAPPYRYERIKNLLNQTISLGKKLSANDMRVIQGDVVDLHARKILPILMAIQPKNEREQLALKYIHSWDGAHDFDSVAASIYQAWLYNFMSLIFEDDTYGTRINKASLISSFPQLLTERFFKDPGNLWCDRINTEKHIESCADIAGVALSHALKDLSKKYGDSMQNWSWGAVHKQHLIHLPFSNDIYARGAPIKDLGALNRWFFREIDSRGSGATINVGPASFWEDGATYYQHWNVSYRQIIDMGKKNSGLYMLSTGQSGNIVSVHYDDLLKLSRDIEYISMSDYDASAGDHLVLKPIT